VQQSRLDSLDDQLDAVSVAEHLIADVPVSGLFALHFDINTGNFTAKLLAANAQCAVSAARSFSERPQSGRCTAGGGWGAIMTCRHQEIGV
jgi:hypothetical protein